jgi:hypothetical protein
MIGLSALPYWTQTRAFSQMPERVNGDVALDRALKTSSLTFQGKPFHAVMEVGTVGEEDSGRIEFWWANASKYHVTIHSPKFSRTKTVNGERAFEQNDGDFYPQWLETFVLAVLDPVPMEKNVRGRGISVDLGVERGTNCIRHDDRTDGITDYLTYGMVCFVGTEPRVGYLYAFNYTMFFGDWKKFDGKQIPRSYITKVLDEDKLVGHLTLLERLNAPDESMFAVDSMTPPEATISTTLVSTQTGESLVEAAPAIQWPGVHEGNTQGFITLYVRTDRTGQVREAFRYNADQQPELAGLALQKALNYKFKPMIADGVPKQMEMPLVIHFFTSIGDPIPVLSVADMAKQTVSCKPNSIPTGLLPQGTAITLRVTVDEKGQTVDVRPSGGRCQIPCPLLMGPENPLNHCRFAPVSQNGRATKYQGDVEVVAP